MERGSEGGGRKTKIPVYVEITGSRSFQAGTRLDIDHVSNDGPMARYRRILVRAAKRRDALPSSPRGMVRDSSSSFHSN